MVTFSCKVTGDISMLAQHGRQLLALVGKPESAQGIITPEQIPEAIYSLRAAIAAEPPPNPREPDDALDAALPTDTDALEHVSLRQRAFPLLQMLERAQSVQEPVLWQLR